MIVDIFNIIQKLRDTGFHLKVDEEPKSIRGPYQNREVRGRWAENARIPVIKLLPLACSIAPTLSQLTKSLAKALCVVMTYIEQ